MAIIWKRVGLVLLTWVGIGTVGIMLFMYSSQFHNHGYVIDKNSIVSKHIFISNTCTYNHTSTCYNTYIIFNNNISNPNYCELLADTDTPTQSQAITTANMYYPIGSIENILYRRLGTTIFIFILF